MNVNLKKWVLVAAAAAMVMAVMVVAGCSSNKGSSDAPAASSQPAPAASAPSGEAGHEMSPDMVMPAGTIPEIWTQIAGEQTKLTAAIQNGQLKDVHHLAFGIRDLVVALADKAKAASPASAPKLDGMVAQVKASATKLDELGDAGNLSGTQAEYAKLETVLGALKSVTGGK
ncbi:MAG: hypothetical protein IT347_03935 [Candidatus Eisenbacteria bacterium]|nr:hypothetical protein [Candidatus Eisenbacteria bacterium]